MANKQELREAAIERIKFFEKELRERYGIIVRMGAEIEFFPLGEGGKPDVGILDDKALNAHLSSLPWVHDAHMEPASGAQYEIVTGLGEGKQWAPHDADTTSALVTAEAIDGIRQAFRENAKRWGLSGVSFAARPFPESTKLEGNGLHLNLSLWSEDGKNLFCEKGKTETDLEKHVLKSMLDMQRDAFLAYAPYPESYSRLYDIDRLKEVDITSGDMNQFMNLMSGSSPDIIGHLPNKGVSSMREMRELAMNIFFGKPLGMGSIASRYASTDSTLSDELRAMVEQAQKDPNHPLAGQLSEDLVENSFKQMDAHQSISPDAHRIENRLPGGDVDPYVAIAVDLAAVYDAVTKHARANGKNLEIETYREEGFPEHEMAKDVSDARKRFVSAHERLAPLLGEELYQQVIKSYKGKSQLQESEPDELHHTSAVIEEIRRKIAEMPTPVKPVNERASTTVLARLGEHAERIAGKRQTILGD